MCMRTNSSYSPRRLTSMSAATNRRRSEGVSLLTSLRVYTMAMTPLCSLAAARRTAVAHAAAACVPHAQPCGGAEFVHSRARRGERGRIRLVVVDHGHPTAVHATHQVQWPAVHGDVPRAGDVTPRHPVVVSDADDAPSAV